MLSALHGEVKEAIDTEDHRFKPVVTNHKLAEYLEKEVRSRAAVIEEHMEPDLLTGIHPPHNFYKRLKEPISDVIASSQDQQLTSSIRMAIHAPDKKGSDARLSSDQELRRQTLLNVKKHTGKLIGRAFESLFQYHSGYYSSIICDFLPKLVAVPYSETVQVRPSAVPRFYEISGCGDAPILILQGNQWIITPSYPNVITVIHENLPSDILFFKPRRMFSGQYRNRAWDTYLSDF